MKRGLRGDIIFDTSILIEIIAGTDTGKRIASLLKEEVIRAFTTELNIIELRYVLCRKAGWEKASEIVDNLIRSGYIKIISTREISERAALLKCQRALSLIDCFTIAAGETTKRKVMFARKEKELENELKRKQFQTTIIFAADIGGSPS